MTKLTRKLLFLCILCKVLVFYCPGILCFADISTGYPVPVSDFASHRITRPTVYHGREKRQISHTRHTDGHISDLMITLELHGKAHVIDLQLKRDLLSQKYFQKHYESGNEVITRPSVQEADLCHYQGHVRGVKESWVALSTCAGLQGVIYDGRDLHYIQPKNETLDSDHFVYRHSDLTRNYTCGYHNGDISSHLRAVRSAPQGPFKADSRSRYLELVLVVDNKEFTVRGGGDLSVMHRRCKDIANIVNALYNPLNIFIALVGVVVWSERDEINLSHKADETLTNFLTYRRMRLLQDHPNDNAQLLTGTTFEGGIVGKALKGPICTYEYSGGVNMDHSSVVGLVASTVAHEMGHNLGMEHDNESNCQCPNDRCIMAASTSNVSPTQWSTCSLESLAFSFQKGMDFCLRNKPAALFDGPTCGNSFLEEGEECDCGLQAHCKNPCCNPLTCKLHGNATCATGECCDLKTCKVRTAGTECRSAAAECDLPEFCSGKSEFCPADLHKMNGLSCGNDKAYCYNGSCRSHSDQCRLLWGPSGKDSELQCYKQNSQGNRTGHCGLNRVTNKYSPCEQGDIMCGLLHCSHLNEQLEFGMESVAVLYHSFFNFQGRIIPCRTASVDLGLSDPDPGLVPDGAVCGEGKMCVKQKCTAVKDVTAGLCPNGCGGNGVCNSLGKCFCNPGYAYPNCDVPGVGGSEDGGPAADPNKSSAFVIGLYVFFLGIVPLLIILFCLWYHCCKNSRNRQQWLRKLTGRGTTKIPLPSRGSPDFTRSAGNPKRAAFWQIWRSKDSSASQRSDELLPTTRQPNHPLPPVPPTANGHLSSFNANSSRGDKEALGALFGNYKGFSLSPLSEQPDSSFDSVDSCVEIPLTPPAAPAPTSQVAALKTQFLATSNTAPPPHPVSTTANAVPIRPAPTAPPTVQPTSVGILAGRTTLKSLISPPIPANLPNSSKPSISAPTVPPSVKKNPPASNEVPVVTYAQPNKPSATITPMRRAPSVPPTKEKDKLPEIHTEIVITKTIEPIKNEKPIEDKPTNSNPFQLRSLFKSRDEPDSGKTPESTGGVMFRFPSTRKQDKDKEKKDEKRSDSTPLQRVTSLFKSNTADDKEKVEKTVEPSKAKDSGGKGDEGSEAKGAMTLPRVQNLKASKIDRQSLRNLEISDPIPQSNIELPTKVVPVRTAPTPPSAPRVTFSTLPRQKSLEGKDTNRAESMRLGQVTSRPAIPQFGSMRGKRPLSVPAARPTSPPPNPPQKEAEYMYDDCFNTVAPLAKLEEEAGSPGDNIYSVIDDPGTPADPRLVKLKSLDDTVSASSNSSSDGLLSEIVNELQKKNLNSIYSTTVKTSSAATSSNSLPATTCVTSPSSAYPVAIPSTGVQRLPRSEPYPATTINYTKPIFSTPAYTSTNSSKSALFNPPITSLTTPYSVGKVPSTSATAGTASSSVTASRPVYSVTKVPTTSATTTVATPSTVTTASVKVPTSSGVSLTPVAAPSATQTYKPYSVASAARSRYLEGSTAPTGSVSTMKPTSPTSPTSPMVKSTPASAVLAVPESIPVASSAVTKHPTSASTSIASKKDPVVSSKAGTTTTSSASSSLAAAKSAKPAVKTAGSNAGLSKVSVGKAGAAGAKVSTNSNAKPTKSSSIAIKLTSPVTATTPSASATSVSSLGMNNPKASSAVDGRPSHVMSMQQKFDNTKGKAAASVSSSSGARKQGNTPGSRSTKS